MGRVGRAAVKALYARQHTSSDDHRLGSMLRAALWALVDVVTRAPPKVTWRSPSPVFRPLVYADAYVKVGEEQWHMGEGEEFAIR